MISVRIRSALLAFAAATAAAGAPPLPKVRIAPSGRSLATSEGKPYVPFGVSYYRPGTGWAPQVWKMFDAEATRKDFEILRGLGANCVRVFLSYASFCPEAGKLDPDGLVKFDRFLALAEEAGLYVHPTGPDHWEGVPAWVTGDRIADEGVVKGLEAFWTAFAARYRGRSVLFAYDLRNEPAVGWDEPGLRAGWNRWLAARYGTAEKAAAAWGVAPEGLGWGDVPPPPPEDRPGDPRLLDFQRCREEVADEWTRRQADAIRAADPEALVTVGLIQNSAPVHLPGGPRHYSAFRPDRQARFLDFLEVHFYPVARGLYQYESEEERDRNLAYLESVVREAARPGKPVVLAEFGWYGGGRVPHGKGQSREAGEAEQAGWCAAAVGTTEGLACGWLNWGLHDHPGAGDVSRFTGLLTADGREKAWARAFRDLAGRLTAGAPASAAVPRGERPEPDRDRILTSGKAGREHQEAYYRAFVADRRK